ncbi:MAG: hypothetical protein FWG33_01835 [Oscillospiraceae bacterium]|nr:hypothetical protein [Oscillospiraceae bacterium]
MRLAEWVCETREENENLDIFLQVTRLLLSPRKGSGTFSPAFYEVDANNNVTFVEAKSFSELELPERFRAPEIENSVIGISEISEKSNVFSLGLLLYFLLHQKLCPVNRGTSSSGKSFLKSRKKNVDTSAFMANDSNQVSLLMERMTSYNPESRPFLKEVLSYIYSNNMCKFGIIRENILSKEHYIEIVRCFSERDIYSYIPEKEYIVDLVTIVPLTCEPMLIPFRLVKKQYILPVDYGSGGRWHCVKKKADAVQIEDLPVIEKEAAEGVHKAIAALHFCDAVYGVEGHALFCETDGYSYEMGFYEHFYGNKKKEISIFKEGEVAVPQRLEARILSILREGSKAVYDLFCVAVYGKQNPATIKTINDLFPEAVRIYHLDDDDILKGASLYLNQKKKSVIKEGGSR